MRLRPLDAIGVGVMLGALSTGCSDSYKSNAAPVVTTTTGVRPATVGCNPSARPTLRRLESPTGSVWVWIESATPRTFRVGSLIKVVWRITGSGPPRVALSDPLGDAARLTFGPELHMQSTFRHPGAEYGTGFTPTTPGCWRLTMRRGDVGSALAFLVTR